MIVAVIVGVCIYLVYKKYYNGVIYSRTYGLTLVGMTILTCMVTLAISTNIVISLGMVGALSIVRYRTAIKEPIDLLYMFWAITSGITIGASMYILVALGFITMLVFIMLTFGKKSSTSVYIMMVQYIGNETSDEVLRELSKMTYTVKSKIIRDKMQEMTLQITCEPDKTIVAERIKAIEKVQNVTLVKYNGEYYA